MEAAPQVNVTQRAKPTFKTRFKAWWEGYDLPGEAPDRPLPQSPRSGATPAAQHAPLPVSAHPAREVAQQIWGAGFDQPGGGAFILNLVKPFALNPSMTVMDFGAALGGGTRAVSQQFDIWVQGFEADPDLVQSAQALSEKQGVKKAEFKPYRAESFEPKPASCDCIYSHAALYRRPEKAKLLTTFERTLKFRGQCSITDFVRAPGVAEDDSRLKDFMADPAETPCFWSDEEYATQFKALRIDLRVNEDQTANYRSAIIDGWVNFTNESAGLACAKAYPAEAVAEVGLWTRRVAVLDSGALQLRRYYGIKMGPGTI